MKKLSLLFSAFLCLALVSCKTRLDNLAANSNDDVYANPYKDPKPMAKVANNNVQYQNNNNQANNQQQGYNGNTGKIAATHADSINPNYKDPNFNYDDYYDNAYAARVSRFQNPVYGTGYYDSYYTNQYSYTGNPNNYGNSIYSSNNYPSNNYNSYNNYGMGNYGMSGYGNSMYGGGYGGGYGSGLSVGVGYGSGYGGGFYSPSMAFGSAYNSPYYGMGYGAYNPYGMYGYNSYGMGYNPYGYSSFGYGYGGYGYNPYGSMYGGGYGSGYYNPYDYNSLPTTTAASNSNTYNGPRTAHTGGNSAVTATNPRGTGMREEAPHTNSPSITPRAIEPSNMERFNQVSIPKENMTRIVEEKSPTRFNTNYQPVTGANMLNNNNGFQQQAASPRGNFNQNGANNNGSTNYPNSTRPIQNSAPQQQVQQRPTRWFNSAPEENNSSNTRPGNFNQNSNSGFSEPTRSTWGGNSNFGGGSSGGSFGGGRSSGGGGGSFGGGGHSGGGRR